MKRRTGQLDPAAVDRDIGIMSGIDRNGLMTTTTPHRGVSGGRAR